MPVTKFGPSPTRSPEYDGNQQQLEPKGIPMIRKNDFHQNDEGDPSAKLVLSDAPVEWSGYLLCAIIGFGFGCGLTVILAHL